MKIPLKILHKWHRYLGVSIALFVIPLAITGILLNHTSDAELDSTYVTQNWLLDHYSIAPPNVDFSYSAKQHWLSQWENDVYLNKQHLGNTYNQTIGFLKVDDVFILGFNNEIWLLTTSGELLEKIRPLNNISENIKNIGYMQAGENYTIYVVTNKGTLISDDMLASWIATKGSVTQQKKITWSKNQSLPEELNRSLSSTQRHHILKWERVIQDLHSGRLFGDIGVLVVDIIGVIFLFLAGTGFYMWVRRILK